MSGSYSKFNPAILKKKGRLRVAKQIISLLGVGLGKNNIKNLKVLDVGCSSGIITHELAKNFKEVWGIDIDENSVNIARKTFVKPNLFFSVMDGSQTSFENAEFDLVIANQVYYCFPEPEIFFNETYRVLKTGGACLLGARNKYTLWDPQFRLPLLSFLPKSISDFLVKFFGRADGYNVSYLSYRQLTELTKKFEVIKYTPRILHSPKKFGFHSLVKYNYFLRLIPEWIWGAIEPFLPNFIWLLKKK